jgi:polysaccharide pyruvyl transferase WcaK-like protein
MSRLLRPRPTTFGLLWHSPNSSNYGVGALTAAHVGILEDAARALDLAPTMELAGWSDPMPTYVAGPDLRFHAFDRGFLLRRNGLAAMAQRSRIVLDIAAGDSFTDLYGAKRFWYQALSKLVVLAMGTPLVLAPQTIGPFASPWSRSIARRIMRRCVAVATRDKLSTTFVRTLDPAIRLVETTDVAFALEAPPLARPRDGKVHVGMNVSGLLFAGGYKRRNDFRLCGHYPDIVQTIIGRFARRSDCIVHLFSHVVIPRKYEGVAEDDYLAAMQLASEFGDNVIAEPPCGSPQETKAHIAAMDFFCGSRMHACVAAFSARVPTVPLAYSRKFHGLFGTLGYEWVADLRCDDAETVVAKVMRGFDDRDALGAQIKVANDEAQRRLDDYRSLVQSVLGAPVEHRGTVSPDFAGAGSN